jgi:hypothetical protein
VPIEDLEALEAEDEYWSRAADEAVGEWEAAGIPIEDIARDLGIDLAADPDAAP